jgi:hypothetical protein
LLVLLVATPAAVSALAASVDVGVNSAVNTNAIGTPPGGVTRRLVVGQKVVFNEHIVTDPGGSVVDDDWARFRPDDRRIRL